MTLETRIPVSIAGLTKRPARIEDEIVVGKDILELLTGAMYADPLTVYREYVQNSADALDDAREAGFNIKHEPQITVWLDHEHRSVRIRDIGIGVPNRDFIRRLTAIGASPKCGKARRGFRGVGRLSGLGYCQELVFRSRAAPSE
jgi:molecular chaperone HtpG